MAKISKYNHEGYKDLTPYEALKRGKRPKAANPRSTGQSSRPIL